MSLPAPRVLIVDDEPRIRRALRVALRANGYDVAEAETGEAGLTAAAVHPPEIVILDLALPDIDGIMVCRQLREWSQVPIIVLSVRDDDDAKVRALDEGADDYVTKPFSVPELLARMRVALRRAAGSHDSVAIVRSFDVEIDISRRTVSRAGMEIHLTPTEYSILRYMAVNAGRVITHGQLLRSALGVAYEDATGNLRVYIAGLRKKLEIDPARPRLIVTEPGVGYRLRSD